MTPPTIVFGREKKFRLGGTSFPTLEDFFLGPGSRTKYRYDTYGNVTVCNPDGNARGGASNTTVGNTIFFAGESFDTATGLYFDNARYYDPTMGRFH